MNVLALAGGVGGAKLADGLYRRLPPHHLTVLGNTADDFTLWGLEISPDLDTVMYTLGGRANPATGWGIVDDTWHTLAGLAALGVDTWFRIGDGDFATHIRRTELLRSGQSLTAVTAALVAAHGIQATLLPMCDEPVHTVVHTPVGPLPFQEYFVRRQHRDPVSAIELTGISAARLTAAVAAAITAAEVVVFCPSNPIVSIGPILAVPGLRAALAAAAAPRIAVSPIIGGAAVRGPAAGMLSGLGLEATAQGVAALYRGLLTGVVIDTVDAALAPAIRELGMDVLVCETLMHDQADRERLADEILAWAGTLSHTTTGE